jgi:tRNA dimethylallyltransferase
MAEPLWVLVGPTASGKTALAVRLAEAVGGEIVSADSVQVYRHFDVGTGKPTPEERARAPHHLVDVVEPDEPLDAARWVELADAAIDEIRSRGRRPIVCGGTFLYVRALLHGLAEAPPADAEIRARHTERAEREGRAVLHEELRRVDPVSAERLNPNDFVRVSRALEVFELSQVPLSEWQARHGFGPERHAARLIGLRQTPDALDARIASRVHAMFDAGWIDEVRGLVVRGWAATRPMGSVGYKQIARVLESAAALDEAELRDEVRRATRVFARRQRTWLRDQPVTWLDPDAALDGDVRVVLDELSRSPS